MDRPSFASRLRPAGLLLGLLLGVRGPAAAEPTKADCDKDPSLGGCPAPAASLSKKDCLLDKTLPGCAEVSKAAPDPDLEAYCAKYPESPKCGAEKLLAPQPDAPPGEEAGETEPAGPSGETDAAAAGEPAAAVQVEREALDQSNARALNSVGQGGAYFNSQSRAAESLPDGGAGAGGPGGAGGGSGRSGASAGGRSGDPSNPKTAADLQLAATSGFGDAFKMLGLKPGSPITRADGRPASPADLAALGDRIRSEPRALMARPDFFKVLSRERFDSLKKAYAEKPELAATAFKQIALTPAQRDFVYSESCTALSGGCNPHARETSYRKGAYVAPEDLDDVAAGLAPGGAESAENPAGAAGEDARNPAAAIAAGEPSFGERAKKALDRLRGMMKGLEGFFGLGGDAAAAGADGQTPPVSGWGRLTSWLGWGGSEGRKTAVEFTSSAGKPLGAVPPAAATNESPRSARPGVLLVLALIVGVWSIIAAFRRRKEKTQGRL